MLKNLKITYLFLFFILCLPLEALSAVTLTVGEGSGDPGSSGNQVVVRLDNPGDIVSGVSVDIFDTDDFLTITGCSAIGRASAFMCSKFEHDDGYARVILVSTSAETIPKGSGEIITLEYDVSGDAPSGKCRSLVPENVLIGDEYKNPLNDFETVSGEFCFNTVGGTVGCVDNSDPTTIYEFGDIVLTSCTFNGDMKRSDTAAIGHGLIVGAPDITIDGNGFCLDGEVKTCDDAMNPQYGIYNLNKHNVTIKDLEIKNFCTGIRLEELNENLIDCCDIHDNGDQNAAGFRDGGIWQEGVAYTTISNCKIHHNVADPNVSAPPAGHGIYLCVQEGSYDTGNVWTGNEIYENIRCGAFFRCKPIATEVSYNYIHDNGWSGVRAQCINCQSGTFKYNYVTQNGTLGANHYGEGEASGITIGGHNSNPNTACYNVCTNNQGYGMEWIRNAKLGCMYENTLCGNTLADLRIWQASGGATISGACNVYDTESIKAMASGPGADWACGDQPTAGFSTSESVLGTISFTDSSTPGSQGNPIGSWYWDFGDCSDPGTSTDQNPAHTYARGGTYTVCLSVNDANVCGTTPCDSGYNLSCTGTEGRRDTVCQQVVVQEPPQEQPDLVISEKSEEWIDPANPSQGYKVHYTVKNQGTGKADASVTCLTIDGTASGTDQDCPVLDAGDTHSGTFEGPFICSDDSDTVKVCADCDEDVTEGSEENNCKENEWTCDVPEPDLVISEKSEEWIDPAYPSQGYKVHYTVKNQGTGSAEASTTKLTIDGIEQTTASCDLLCPGDTYLGTFEGPFYCSDSSDTIKVCADCTSQVDESDEDNNCKENVWSCSANLFDIGDGAGKPGDTDKKVGVSLTNAVDVAGIQVDICDAGDYLSLASVELTGRTAGFICDFEDDYPQAGCARLLLYSEGGSFIAAGDGPIFILHYDVDTGAEGPSVEINSENLLVTDEDNNPLTAMEDPGNFLLLSYNYGDIWPYDETTGVVGDGKVNIFDIIRDIQIILKTYTPIYCEFMAGNVPTGFGDNCVAPDEDINVFDVLEMVAKILGRPNCIDTY